MKSEVEFVKVTKTYAKTLIPKVKGSCYSVAVIKQEVKAERVQVVGECHYYVAKNPTNHKTSVLQSL